MGTATASVLAAWPTRARLVGFLLAFFFRICLKLGK